MINVFAWKRRGALVMCSMISTISFFIGVQFYGFLWGIVFLLLSTLVLVPIGSLFLRNPFQAMLEGQGLLALAIDSTGIIKPFIVGLKAPYVLGRFNKKEVADVFDRNAVFHLASPTTNKSPVEIKNDGGIKFELDHDSYNKSRMGLYHYPVLIYNEQINSFITKDWFSNKEASIFAEHGVLYLNRKMEELSSQIRDFGRHVVESLKPAKGLLKQWWFWLILVFMGVVFLALFGPAIFATIQNFLGTGTQSVVNAAGTSSTNAITPR